MGSAQHWPAIWAMNADTVADPHSLEEGQYIRIPMAMSEIPVDTFDWASAAADGVAEVIISNCGTPTALVCQGQPTTRVFLSVSN